MSKEKKRIKLFLLLLCLFTLTGCEQSNEKILVAWPYYTIKKEDEIKGYLIGTIHVGKEEMYPFPEEMLNALSSTKYFITEVLMNELNDPNASIVTGGAMTETPITEGMTAESLEKYRDILKEYGYTEEDVVGYSRYGVTDLMQSKVMDAKGPAFGVDNQLAKHAEKNKKQTNIALETVAQQLLALPKIAEYPKDINEWVAQLPGIKENRQQLNQLLAAYVDGEVLEKYASAESMQVEQEVYDLMLTDRNVTWMDILPTYLEEANQSFIAVGAGHLAGESGLIQLLSDLGYTVELVDFKPEN